MESLYYVTHYYSMKVLETQNMHVFLSFALFYVLCYYLIQNLPINKNTVCLCDLSPSNSASPHWPYSSVH